jgi:hypothetical protein
MPSSTQSNAPTASNTTAVDEAVLTLARLLGEAAGRDWWTDSAAQSTTEKQIDATERED